MKRRAHAKARLRFDGAGQAVLLPFQFAHRNIQHGHLHAAGDIHADRVRNHRVLGRQHAANGQTVADVRVRHERARHRDRQQARLLHLHHRLVLQTFAPLTIFDRFSARRRRRIDNGFGEFLAHRILGKQSRIRNDRFHFLFEPGFVAAAENELRNEIRRAPRGFTQRNAESNKIFGVHNNPRSTPQVTEDPLLKRNVNPPLCRSQLLDHDVFLPGLGFAAAVNLHTDQAREWNLWIIFRVIDRRKHRSATDECGHPRSE